MWVKDGVEKLSEKLIPHEILREIDDGSLEKNLADISGGIQLSCWETHKKRKGKEKSEDFF